jgi:hypothetical protein
LLSDVDTQPESGPWYRNLSIGRVAVVAFILASALFWIWALGPLAPRGNADRLDDRSFPDQAETICARYRQQINELPPAHLVGSVDERITDVTAGTELATAMLAELNALTKPSGEDAAVVALWFDDWDGYIEDRNSYVDRLIAQSEGDDLRFLLTDVDGVPIDERIGNFARVNDMASCEVPGDV